MIPIIIHSDESTFRSMGKNEALFFQLCITAYMALLPILVVVTLVWSLIHNHQIQIDHDALRQLMIIGR